MRNRQYKEKNAFRPKEKLVQTEGISVSFDNSGAASTQQIHYCCITLQHSQIQKNVVNSTDDKGDFSRET